jgi:uncharacterized protein YraI
MTRFSKDGDEAMNIRKTACAAGILALSAGAAAAATARVETDLNVRSGQGTGYPVIAVMPAGAIVDVSNCGDGWCYVRDYGGFASASYLDRAGVVYGSTTYVAPPAVVVGPPAVYTSPYYYDPAPPRFIRRGIRAIEREVRREIRQDRREDRREARQERREERREARQERRADRRNN